MPPLLEAKNLTKTFSSGFLSAKKVTVALDDFSLAIQGDPPSITAIVGESGSGKTTLARLLLGLAVPTKGQVLYRGHDLQKLTAEERRSFLSDVQVIFQDPYEVYNPFYKVDHVLEAPIQKLHLASSPDKARTMMEDVLRAVGLRPDETLGRFPHQLSGGQRQRVMVARALLFRPRLIIADEPVSMVDASLRATILDNLRALNREFGISLIYITHDLTTAYQVSENIIVLYRGSVAEAGDVEEVVREPKHPYTQLLIGSVPLPDPKRSWKQHKLVVEANGSASKGYSGCKFADRCPHALPICRESRPPLFQTGRHRATSCMLYQDRPRVELVDMDKLFVSAPPQSTSEAIK